MMIECPLCQSQGYRKLCVLGTRKGRGIFALSSLPGLLCHILSTTRGTPGGLRSASISTACDWYSRKARWLLFLLLAQRGTVMWAWRGGEGGLPVRAVLVTRTTCHMLMSPAPVVVVEGPMAGPAASTSEGVLVEGVLVESVLVEGGA